MTSQHHSPTALYVACVGLTIATCVVSVFAYLQSVDFRQLDRQARSDRDAVRKTDAALRKKIDEIGRMTAALGYRYDEIGNFEPADEQTVLASVYRDIKKLELNLPKLSVNDALQDLSNQKQSLLTRQEDLLAQSDKLRKTLSQLEVRWNNLLEIEKQAHKKTQKEMVDLVGNKEEMASEKDKKVAETNRAFLDVSRRLNELKEIHEKYTKASKQKAQQYLTTINRLEKRVGELAGELQPDEPADGKLVRVDLGTKKAWINLGKQDRLKRGILFLAYSPDALDSSQKNVKAKLRVTSILGPNLAEVQIIDPKLGSPIVAGDVISSVLWSPGFVEKVAIAGIVDLDGDGLSDLQSLKIWLDAAGAEVVAYTGEDGNHQGKQIDGTTNLLVSATVPGLSKIKDDKEQIRLEKIRQHAVVMRKAAETNGVEVISLNRFLKRVGYKSKR